LKIKLPEDAVIKHCPAVILARGGSKGIHKKNIMDFAGKPLLTWSILQAFDSGVVDTVYVSSDSDEILDVAVRYGAVAIRRPDELATDTTTSEAALTHALDQIHRERGTDPERIIFLQATSPLRESSDIAGAVRAFDDQHVDSLFSDAVLDDFCAWAEEDGVLKGKTFDPWNRGRRQERKPLYLENGSIYIFKPSLLRNTGNRLGGKIGRYSMPFWKSFEIDTLENAELCELYFRKHLLHYWRAKETPFNKKAIKLMVYDFDGVMTNNHALQFQDGTEAVWISRADGWGVDQIRKMSIPQLIISTETNTVVAARAKKLKIEVIHGSGDKKADLLDYCSRMQIELSGVLYVGNDVNDLEAMQMAGLPVAPVDAHPSIIAIAKHITRAKGGEGVIKELSEYVAN
jgi:YrbI family 3-deoxy-D-manno-octulosonate 8-phosphate phosphatase